MNINSISSTQIQKLTSASLSQAPAQSSADTDAADDVAASAQLSGPAQLMSKLAQLKQADPEKFKEIVSGMASTLTAAAAQVGGHGKQLLTDFASKLTDVANGGDISQLKPPGPGDAPPPGAAGPAPAGGHGHAHGAHGHHRADSSEAARSYAATSAADSTDPSSAKTAFDAIFEQLDSALGQSAAG
jgi:hypothetical protein